MKRASLLTMLAFGGLTTAVIGAAAVSAAHSGPRGHGWHDAKHAVFGPGMHGAKHGGHGPREMLRYLDANGDNALERTEAEGTIVAKLAQFDADRDQVLTLEEFEGLWLDFTRSRMVDRFQHLDENGDGRVTEAEMTDPLDHVFARVDMNEDGRIDREDRREIRRLFMRHRYEQDDD
ncbi:MAG: hypothetical protein AAFU49_14760 [Pseudomonadota bacterium]